MITSNKIIISLALMAMLAAAPQSHADDNPHRGPYFGVEASAVRYGLDRNYVDRNFAVEDPSATQVKNDTFGYGIYGGYRFFKYLAVDGGYMDLGEAKIHVGFHSGVNCNSGVNNVCSPVRLPPADIRQTHARGPRIRASGTLPLNDRWSLDARVGGAIVTYGDSGIAISTYGIGASGRVQQSLIVRLFWDRYSALDRNDSATDALSIGLAYQF